MGWGESLSIYQNTHAAHLWGMQVSIAFVCMCWRLCGKSPKPSPNWDGCIFNDQAASIGSHPLQKTLKYAHKVNCANKLNCGETRPYGTSLPSARSNDAGRAISVVLFVWRRDPQRQSRSAFVSESKNVGVWLWFETSQFHFHPSA